MGNTVECYCRLDNGIKVGKIYTEEYYIGTQENALRNIEID